MDDLNIKPTVPVMEMQIRWHWQPNLIGNFIIIIINGGNMLMTKSHHGGNLSLRGEVGFCHRHIPTIDNYNDD